MKKNFITVLLMVLVVLTMSFAVIACQNTTTDDEPAIETVKTPVITPDGGEFVGDVSVDITSATTGAIIRYTTDGTDPTATSTIFVSGTTKIAGTFSEAGTIVKAKAFKDGMNASEVATSKGFISIEPGLYLRGSMNGWGMSDRANYKFTYNSTTEEYTFSVNKDLTGDQAFKIVGGFVGWNDNASLCPTNKSAADVKAGDDDATADLQWSLPKDGTYGVYPTTGVGLPIDVAIKGGGQNFIYSVGTDAVYKIIVSDLEIDAATGLLAGKSGAPAYDANITTAKARFESTNIGTFPPPYFKSLKWYVQGGFTDWGFADSELMELASDANSIYEVTSDVTSTADPIQFTIATSDWAKRYGPGTYANGTEYADLPAENKSGTDVTVDLSYQTSDCGVYFTVTKTGVHTVRIKYDGEGIFNNANVSVHVVSPK